MDYQKTILKNGLTVVTHSLPKRDSVSLGIWIKAGGRYENKDNNGIAHFLEHLVFKGTKSYSCNKIKESIEGVGGALNAMTAQEHTCYFIKIPSKFLKIALNVLSEMVTCPSLKQEEVDKERFVILEEIKMYRDLPQAYVHELLDELIWPKHPLGFNLAGTFETVSKINSGDLKNFIDTFYTPSNLIISASGKIKHKELVNKIEDIFGNFKKSTKNTFLEFKNSQKAPVFNILNKDTAQGHLAIGFHSVSNCDQRKFIASLLHIILGANMSSRLFNEVREKRGLAYEIGTQVRKFRDSGAFIVHAGIDNNKTVDAVRVILEELNRIKKDLVTDDEFKRAKDFFIGQLSLSLEDTLDNMFWIGEQTVSLNKIYTLKEIIAKLSKIKRENLRELANSVFLKDNLSLSFIGKVSEEDKIKQSILCLS
ncbi:MAG: pitrilysin family protein [Candidatus Omnitrophota bacterium]